MSDITISCPSCGTPIPLSEAVTRQIRERLTQDFEAHRQAQEKSLAERERKLRDQQATLARTQSALDEQVRHQLESAKDKLLAEARQQVQSQLALEMQDLRNQLNERADKLQQAQKNELELRQQQRALEERQHSLELELARKLDSERAKIREEAARTAAEAERLKLAEKEKLISDLQREIQNLKQKAEQGSMQLQGEVLELDLEARLAAQFPYDGMDEVAKGQRGADLLQRVRTNTGQDCGAILWEAKRAKNWGGQWIAKLKEDQRVAKAELAVLVSQTLPPGVRGFGLMDGVWVCDFESMIPLAAALRQGLVSTAVARLSETGRQGKMEQLYQFLTSVEFRQQVEGVVEAFKSMREDLEVERRALQKHWSRREKQLEQAVMHTAVLYGSVQGIVGQNALPDIQSLRLDL